MELNVPVPGPVTDTFIPACEYRDPAWDTRERERMTALAALFDLTREELEKRGAPFPATMTLEKLLTSATDWHIFNEIYAGFEAFAGQCEFLEEDFANMVAVNKGMKSQGFSGATLNPLQEGSISNFHRVLRRYVDVE